MSRKLAIAISGAVSLGSYEAGVMYEVLEAIAVHNALPENNDKRIEIDVITGASAGGMTAGILAQKLLCDGKSLRDPYTNPLYKSWVQDVDIGKLLAQDKEKYKFSLLSSEVVESIAREHILDNPDINKSNSDIDTSHPAVAKEIHVGIAMSNLNGWDYIVKPSNAEGDGEFTYTRYKDRFVCRLFKDNKIITISEVSLSHKEDVDGGDIDEWVTMHPANWKKLRECSLSSGAFPFAFEAKKITRCPGKGEFSGREGNTYTYTDGGVFENEPLGLAKKLAECLDKKARISGNNADTSNENIKNDESSRVYLYVAPGHKTSTANTNFGRTQGVDLWTTFQSLIAAIFHQARFQDWIIKEMDSKSPIFQIAVEDKQLIGELFFAFAGFLDIRFRHFDYNIGRESARKALEKFSNKKTNNSSNPNLVYWDNRESGFTWELTSPDKKEAITVNKKNYVTLAGKNSIDELLLEVDLEKRKVIYKALMARLMALIDFVNEKLDEGDKKKSLGFLFCIVRGIWTWLGLKPLVWFIASGFLRRKLLSTKTKMPSDPEQRALTNV
ncbi:MAG: patatin-like phospholipase family protein [Pseudanabaena sp. M007S1SP1A06QC]|jgi:hypothetical protein|nr:patatin-like phospholipase family protein [Pseudanabaena sp. M007S1SP1A06QC]